MTRSPFILSVFQAVADALLRIATLTHLTYNEINVVVYYLLIPLSWTLIIDCKFEGWPFTIAFLVTWCFCYRIGRGSGYTFLQICDKMFALSVDFLNFFNRFGGNYVFNSVIICVLIPILIYALLIIL